MPVSNVKELNLEEMLERARTTVAILEVIYALSEVDDYTKEDAVEELLKHLYKMGYLDHPLELLKGDSN